MRQEQSFVTLYFYFFRETVTSLTKKWLNIIHLFKAEFGVKRFPKFSNSICKEVTQEGHAHLLLINISLRTKELTLSSGC